jgi:DedD protein
VVAAAAPRLEGFAVQVGAFRDESKLDQARRKLVAAKVPHYTERLDAKGGALTRLRAGPFATREAAESALAQLKLSALDGKVVPLP